MRGFFLFPCRIYLLHMNDKKILIVDDSGSMREILTEILKKGGYTNVMGAANGEDGIIQFNKERPDLVILDIIMPGMNGIEVLRTIGKVAKVLVLSAIGQDSIIIDAKKFGALDYLVKPIEENEVLSKVSRYL